MIKLFKNIIILFFVSAIVGEIMVRVTHSVNDIPQRTIDDVGIQKYFPNQTGYWIGGDHTWTVNKFGWPGKLPSSYDNLIMIIGDSYIENFMNPNECHQSVFLKENMKKYNFMEAGRSGVSLIEAMEISKQTDTLNPIHSLIYVNDNDFYESIYEIKRLDDITQLNLEDSKIIYGKMKSPGLKKLLYSCKLLYYFYNRFYPSGDSKNVKKETVKVENPEAVKLSTEQNGKIAKLIKFISASYNVKDKTLVFHPNSDAKIIEMCKEAGFNTVILDSNNDKEWTFEHDSHWTCYGHKKVAEQVSKNLFSNIVIKNQ